MRRFVSAFILMATPAVADVPKVVVDVAPVHSLVAQVMEGVGSPELLVPAQTSPHDFALRPSQARALSSADLIVWVGEGLSPWLEGPLETVAGGADKIELMEQGAIELKDARDASWPGGADHDDHADHKDPHAGHNHGAVDPHVWLDPHNAVAIVALVAEDLAARDPSNAATYRVNAETAIAALEAMEAEMSARLVPLQDASFVTFHDAYQYFEAHFGLTSRGALSLSDASKPSPARVKELRHIIADQNITCMLVEPFFDRALAMSIARDLDIKLVITDPIGAGSYAVLMDDLTTSFETCLK